MRGVVGFALVLLFVFPTLHVLELQKNSLTSNSLAQEKMIAIEKRYYEDLSLKQAVAQVLRQAQGSSIREKVLNASEGLEKLERFVEAKYAEKGVLMDLWFGVLREGEAQELAGRMMDEKRALKCGSCFDFSARALDYDGNIVPKSASVLFASPAGSAFVSKNGLSIAPFPEGAFGDVLVGASFFLPDGKIAFVSLMPEGFG